MKPIDARSGSYAEYSIDSNTKDAKFKIGDHIKISKDKNVFAKGYAPNWSNEVFVIRKVKDTMAWTYVISDLNGEESNGTFYEKELQQTSETEFRVEKVIKRKDDKQYVKQKGYDNSFNILIYKKDVVQEGYKNE